MQRGLLDRSRDAANPRPSRERAKGINSPISPSSCLLVSPLDKPILNLDSLLMLAIQKGHPSMAKSRLSSLSPFSNIRMIQKSNPLDAGSYSSTVIGLSCESSVESIVITSRSRFPFLIHYLNGIYRSFHWFWLSSIHLPSTWVSIQAFLKVSTLCPYSPFA